AWSHVEGVPAVSEIMISSTDTSLLFAATRESGLYHSADAGATWQPANEGLGLFPGTSLAITALAQDRARPGTLYVATAYVLGHGERHVTPSAILLSPNNGGEWITVAEMGLDDPVVTAILPGESNGAGIRAVTDEGIKSYRLDADRALEMLESADPATRLKGAKILSVAAVPTQVGAILPHIYDEQDGEFAYYAARALGQIGGEEVTRELVAIIEGDAGSIVKLRALLALELIADPATVPTLATAYQEDALAGAAAEALATTGSEQAWTTLVAALSDEELTAQRQAALAAFEAHPEEAAAPLITQLDSEDATVRANAAHALGWLGQPQAIEPLRALLDDSDATVRASAALALGELGDRAIANRLAEMSRNDPSSDVRLAAGEAIVRAEQEPLTTEPAEATAPERREESLLERLATDSILWLKTAILTLTAALAILVLVARPRRIITE
ncbi:MAG: HEAT repeat domain-containing protein, partial [Ardenticatenaceae bacterium]